MRLAAAIAAAALLALPAGACAAPQWLAGDLHVHTCYSHDVYCPPDDNTGFDEFYTYGSTVGARFTDAAFKGLDWLAITDHNDVRSQSDPGWDSQGVIGVGAYENSLKGHAQMLGAHRIYDKGDSSATAVNAMAAALRADGGVFQLNHPTSNITKNFNTCSDTKVLNWTYAYDVQPDVMEVWNNQSIIQPAERYWECWLSRGAHIGASGGSDSHWLTLTAAGFGLGMPTTWALSDTHSEAGILAAIKAGRTSISRLWPNAGGAPLLLEADGDRNGSYESVQGATVAPGTPMRLRALKPTMAGSARVRANGRTILQSTLAPGAALKFKAPDAPGWVRATLYALPPEAVTAGCDPNGLPISSCTNDYDLIGMTSPLYLARPANPRRGAVRPRGRGRHAPAARRSG